MPARGDDFKSAIIRSTMRCLVKIFADDGYLLVCRKCNSVFEARKALKAEKPFFPMEFSIGIVETFNGRVVDVAAMKSNGGAILLSQCRGTTSIVVKRGTTKKTKTSYTNGEEYVFHPWYNLKDREEIVTLLSKGYKEAYALVRGPYGSLMDTRNRVSEGGVEHLAWRGHAR